MSMLCQQHSLRTSSRLISFGFMVPLGLGHHESWPQRAILGCWPSYWQATPTTCIIDEALDLAQL